MHDAPSATQMPHDSLQQYSPSPQVSVPHELLGGAGGIASQNWSVQKPRGGVQMPQLSLQQTWPVSITRACHRDTNLARRASGVATLCIVRDAIGGAVNLVASVPADAFDDIAGRARCGKGVGGNHADGQDGNGQHELEHDGSFGSLVLVKGWVVHGITTGSS